MALVAPQKSVKNQTGVSMMEVLITLLILSLGLLGVSSMQFVGSFNNKNALTRTQSVFVAQQMAERLRANKHVSQVADGYVAPNDYFDQNNFNFTNLNCAGSNDFNCYCLELPATVPDCISNDCTPSEFAKFDAHEMSCAAVEANPESEIFVTCEDNTAGDVDSCSAGSIHRVMVRWPATNWQSNQRVGNVACNAEGTSSYDCVSLEIIL
ncbi:MAG: type IV pilus modification protein PilV [Pseudomonadota bacterium]